MSDSAVPPDSPDTEAPRTAPPLNDGNLPRSDAQALADALAADDAAIYAYGTATAFARPERRDSIRTDAAAHRARREAVAAALADAETPAPPAPAGYTLPFPVDDPSSAAHLTLVAEEDCAAAWLSVLERAESESTRSFAATALADCAVRAAGWRSVLGTAPPTVAFPGGPRQQ